MDIPNKQKLVNQIITRGSIFHSDMFSEIDHGKFFVVIGEDSDDFVGYFFINSYVRDFLVSKPELSALQYPLNRANYSFLSHSSYLCCSHLKKISRKQLAESIVDNQTNLKGTLSSEDLQSILEKVKHSKIYSNKEKESFFKN